MNFSNVAWVSILLSLLSAFKDCLKSYHAHCTNGHLGFMFVAN